MEQKWQRSAPVAWRGLAVALVAGLCASWLAAPGAGAQDIQGLTWFAKGNAGFDPIGGGVALGGGAGAEFLIGAGTFEASLSVYYSPYTERYEDGGWQYTETSRFLAVAGQFNRLFTTGTAVDLIFGTGVIVAGVEWVEDYYLIADPTITNTETGEYEASGMLFTVGASLGITPRASLRLEVPAIAFFVADSVIFSLPVTASGVIKLSG